MDPSLGLVSLAGELDREHCPQLAAALATLAGTSHEAWLVDAAQVTFCDAGGLRALAAAAVLARDHGRQLSITASSRCVQRLLTLVGLGDLLLPPVPARLLQPLPGPVGRLRPAPAPGGGRSRGEPAADAPALVVCIDYREGSLRLTGQLDRRNAHVLQDTISVLLRSDRTRWTADIAALAVTDHAGLKAIGAGYRRLLRDNRRITLRGASPALHRALIRLRLDHHVVDDAGRPAVAAPLPTAALSA